MSLHCVLSAALLERSPWCTTQHVGAYPVLRLDAGQLHHLQANRAPTGNDGNP